MCAFSDSQVFFGDDEEDYNTQGSDMSNTISVQCALASRFASLAMCGLKRRNNTNFTNQQLHPSVSVPSERHIPISVHGCLAVWPLTDTRTLPMHPLVLLYCKGGTCMSYVVVSCLLLMTDKIKQYLIGLENNASITR